MAVSIDPFGMKKLQIKIKTGERPSTQEGTRESVERGGIGMVAFFGAMECTVEMCVNFSSNFSQAITEHAKNDSISGPVTRGRREHPNTSTVKRIKKL